MNGNNVTIISVACVSVYILFITDYVFSLKMDELKYCRVCLETDVKMFSLETKSSDSIGIVYSHLAQIPIFDRNQHVCFECANLLYKYHEFKSKCLRAHNLLSRIRLDSSQITRQILKNVDRKINKLESTLKISPVVVVYEECTNNTETEVNKTEHKEMKESEINVKIEEEHYIENFNNIEIENKYDYNEGCTENIIDSMEESVSETIAWPKHKSKHNKEPKTKKRKVKKRVDDDDFSDDEPLSKSATKTVITQPIRKKHGFNFSYFDDYATVVFMTPDDAKKEVLLRKESSNYKTSPFKCDLCYRGFELKTTSENHAKKHSTEYGDYECDICHIRFPQQVHLCKHRLSCHKRKFSCKLCSYICYCTEQAKSHVSLHKGMKYPCKHCGEIFSMSNSLQMHYRTKHLKESVCESVCEFCGDVFGTPKGLFLHSMKLHRQDKNDKLGPECSDCGVHFTTELAWKRHLVLSTKHKVSNGCKFCGETFSNKDDLKTHIRVHSRQSNRYNKIKLPAACAICNRWLQTREEYKAHVTSEHPHSDEAEKFLVEGETPYVCEVCGHMFKRQCFLKYHQRKHTGERPFKCLECNKTFRLAGALSIHSRMHSRMRPHKCEMCARMFTYKSALNKHMKVHLNIRPHKCALCDKGFINLCDLKLHIKYVHDKVPWPKKKNKKTVIDDEDY